MEGPNKPLLLSQEEIDRIHRWVRQYLPPEYDREFVADSVILKAWMKEVPHVSREVVRRFCISAWRSRQRERRRNEEFVRVGATRTGAMMNKSIPGGSKSGERNHDTEVGDQLKQERKMLVEEAVGCLNEFERKLIWMRYYDGQKLEEIASNTTLTREQVQRALQVAIFKMKVHLR